jgi:LmbE family N-acetylglucosaminyl deacetylase
MSGIRCLIWTLGLFLAAGAASAEKPAADVFPPDARFKADLLLVVAHPDDDVVVGGYLARIALDQHKRVAVVYCTNGDGGGNNVGSEAGAALGSMREIEARRALAAFGIENVWFLGGPDTPGQNVLRSLDHWNHGTMLDQVVRLVRLTRPDVILTWLPEPVVGENHEDHQASGVLAVEAFDLAADPTEFPEQIAPPRDRTGMANLTEGLTPWQAKKLYFLTDAFEVFGPYWHDENEVPRFRRSLADGNGPTYDTKTISPSRHASYARLMAEHQAFYQTQEGDIGDRALRDGNLAGFEYAIHLIFGKSLVGGSITGDVFENVVPGAIPFAGARALKPEPEGRLSFAIGDPWHFYALFAERHGLERLGELIPEPEVEAACGAALTLDFNVCNRTAQDVEISVTPRLPDQWSDTIADSRYRVTAGACRPLRTQARAPSAGQAGWQELDWTAQTDSGKIGAVRVHVYLGRTGGLPQ